MMPRIDEVQIVADLAALGVARGDTVLVRAALGAVGRMQDGGRTFVNALVEAVGPDGTVVSLAFTKTAFIRKADPTKAFTSNTPTYAGALPQAMLDRPDRHRSRHPQCSYVAIGRLAEEFTRDHGPDDGAYSPIRKMMGAGGMGLLVGCCESSPGFTTAHLAETDLGLHRRVIFPGLNNVYYLDGDGQPKLFRRRDPGLCSMSFSKFYPDYRAVGILREGNVGKAASMLVELAPAYRIERARLEVDPRFTVCADPDCATCNARRWDRLAQLPRFAARRIRQRLKSRL